MKYVMYTYFDRLVKENGFREALRIAKRIGFSGIEIIDGAVTADKAIFSSFDSAKEHRKILEEEGMTVACYSVGVTLYRSPAVTEGLKMHAEYAAALGAPYLHHTLCLDKVDVSYDEVLADVLPRAIEVANVCRSLGLTCIYEDQGFVFNGVDNFGRFFFAMKAVCDNVGVCADFGNILFADEDAPSFIEAFLPHIKHVHLKDYRKTSERDPNALRCHQTKGGNYLVGVPTGSGSVSFEKGIRLLKQANYSGYCAFEQELAFPEPFLSDTRVAMSSFNKLFEE